MGDFDMVDLVIVLGSIIFMWFLFIFCFFYFNNIFIVMEDNGFEIIVEKF